MEEYKNKHNLGEKVTSDLQRMRIKFNKDQNEGQFVYSWKKLEESYRENDH